MRLFKKIFKALLFPHGAAFIVLVPLSAVLLVYTFTGKEVQAGIEYASYFLSSYTLTAICCKLPASSRFWKEARQRNKYMAKYQKDAGWRMTISLYGSFAINSAYTVLQLGLGIYHATVWYYSMAAYYFMLSVMRFYLLHYLRNHALAEDRKAELYRYRFCGIILVGMNLALAVIVFYITWQNRTFIHHKITTITMAAYTFTTFTMAIVNLAKYRKYQSPVLSAAKIIGFTAAMVSMLTLETTMLTVFGEGEKGGFDRIMTGTTGAAVTLTVLIMAVYMIVKSTKELKAGNNNALHNGTTF